VPTAADHLRHRETDDIVVDLFWSRRVGKWPWLRPRPGSRPGGWPLHGSSIPAPTSSAARVNGDDDAGAVDGVKLLDWVARVIEREPVDDVH
jgi:hypothetical protein